MHFRAEDAVQIIRMQVNRLCQAFRIQLLGITSLQVSHGLLHMSVLNGRILPWHGNGLSHRRQDGCKQQLLPGGRQAKFFIGEAAP